MRGYDLLAGGGYHDGLLVGVYHAGDRAVFVLETTVDLLEIIAHADCYEAAEAFRDRRVTITHRGVAGAWCNIAIRSL